MGELLCRRTITASIVRRDRLRRRHFLRRRRFRRRLRFRRHLLDTATVSLKASAAMSLLADVTLLLSEEGSAKHRPHHAGKNCQIMFILPSDRRDASTVAGT